jgi:hypothetical protein
MNDVYPLIVFAIAFLGVIATFFANNHLQKKLITIKNKEKAIDFLLEHLKDFENLCIDYWKQDVHNENCSLDITIKYKQLNSFINFTYKKYSLKDNNIVNILFLRLFMESTGDDFESKARKNPNPKKVIKISKISNDIFLKFLENKI